MVSIKKLLCALSVGMQFPIINTTSTADISKKRSVKGEDLKNKVTKSRNVRKKRKVSQFCPVLYFLFTDQLVCIQILSIKRSA